MITRYLELLSVLTLFTRLDLCLSARAAVLVLGGCLLCVSEGAFADSADTSFESRHMTEDIVWAGISPWQIHYDAYADYLRESGYFPGETRSAYDIFLSDEQDLFSKAQIGDQEAAIIYSMGAMREFNFEQSLRLAHDDPYQQRALTLLEPLSQRDFPPALTILSVYYKYGLGTQPDASLADVYFARALEQKDSAALNHYTAILIAQNRLDEAVDYAEAMIEQGSYMGYQHRAGALGLLGIQSSFDSREARDGFDAARECWEIARIAYCAWTLVRLTPFIFESESDKEDVVDALFRIAIKEPQDQNLPSQSIETEFGLLVRSALIKLSIDYHYLLPHEKNDESLIPRFRDLLYEVEPYFVSLESKFRPYFALAYNHIHNYELLKASAGDVDKALELSRDQTTEQQERLLAAAKYLNQSASEILLEPTGDSAEPTVLWAAAVNHSIGWGGTYDVKKAAEYARLAATYDVPAASEIKLLESLLLGEVLPSEVVESCRYLCFIFEVYAHIEREYERLTLAAAEREAEQRAKEERDRQLALADEQRRQREYLLRQESIAREEQRRKNELERQQRREKTSKFFSFLGEVLTVMVIAGVIVSTAGAAAPMLGGSSSGSSYSHAPSACLSDYDCGFGNTCVKRRYDTGGICMKTVSNAGRPILNQPNRDSIRVGGSVSRCYNQSHCSIGFTCNLEYNVCVR